MRKTFHYDGKAYLINLGKSSNILKYFRILKRLGESLKSEGLKKVIIKLSEIDKYPKTKYFVTIERRGNFVRTLIVRDDNAVIRDSEVRDGTNFIEEVITTLYEYYKWGLIPTYINGKPVIFIRRGVKYTPTENESVRVKVRG